MRENTIASLKNAHAHGADMVEFDIQLSKDKIPVIYHDFELCTTSLGKNGERKELIPMQLKNLTLAQLRGLKVTYKYCDQIPKNYHSLFIYLIYLDTSPF